jgi:hypothetical protein
MGCLLAAVGARAEMLDAAIQQKIRAATFEVVIPKPVDDPIVYEKPLPMDLLPYQFRMDKYFSIGTAFALGGGRYATAAHVLNSGFGSQFGAPALRDSGGHVYAIAKILKYSSAEDFAVFSLADDLKTATLESDPRPALGETVYAVGNALGEGVVIRDGLYTSDTPEERNGRWKWLRFSAAASPGNSGGPLLDKTGKVIGIVLRKSPSENLNYAVSIDQVLGAHDNLAVIDERGIYQLDIFEQKQTETIHEEFALPKSYAEFGDAYLKIRNSFDDRLLDHLLNKDAEHVFPHGDGAEELLHTLQSSEFPALITRGQDGTWQASRPPRMSNSQLPHNGTLAYGALGSSLFLRLRRPDDVPADTFYNDSRAYMDILLKGIPMRRTVGTEQVRIVSLGKAEQDSIFADGWQRKWQLRVWPVAYEDTVIVSLALPVPDGYVAVTRLARTAQIHESIADLKAMSNFVLVSYGATLDRWRDFRKQTALLPATLSSIDIGFDYGHDFHYKSARCAFSYTPDVQKITKDSELYLDFSFFDDRGKTVWDVARVRVAEDAHNQNLISIARNMRPSDAMNDDLKSRWNRIVHRRHPYDAVIGNDGDLTDIHGVMGTLPGADTEPEVLYTVLVQAEGAAGQDTMKTRLAQVMDGLRTSDDQTLARSERLGKTQD